MFPGMETINAATRDYLARMLTVDGDLQYGMVSPAGDILLAACLDQATELGGSHGGASRG